MSTQAWTRACIPQLCFALQNTATRAETCSLHLFPCERPHVRSPLVAVRVGAPTDRLVVARHPNQPVVVRGAPPVPPGEPDANAAGRGPVGEPVRDMVPRNLRNGGILRRF